MRIYVEYDTNNPDLVRVQDRDASLAIIPAGRSRSGGWWPGPPWESPRWCSVASIPEAVPQDATS